LIFDDTVEHEAWKRSAEARFVLLLDFLRHGMSDTSLDVPPEAVRRLIRRRVDK
jgi:hypothetical protein